jgi:hypothetical protein
MIEEGIRDAHSRSQEGDKDGEGDHQKKQINDSGDETCPETSVRQEERYGRPFARGCHLFFQATPSSAAKLVYVTSIPNTTVYIVLPPI